MKTKIVKYGKGIHTVHIPFIPQIGVYEELQRQLAKIEYPKSTHHITAKVIVCLGLRKGSTSYRSAEIMIER